MAIAWGIEGHLVKADYMAALITAMMATDRFFDHVTNLLDNCFEAEEDEVSCGVLGNQIFKVAHNTGLVLLALYLILLSVLYLIQLGRGLFYLIFLPSRTFLLKVLIEPIF